jgi:hypothetical protein
MDKGNSVLGLRFMLKNIPGLREVLREVITPIMAIPDVQKKQWQTNQYQ